MAEQMLEFFPQLDLQEYVDILTEEESSLTEKEKRLTSEAVASQSVASQSVCMTPFVSVTVDYDEEIDVVTPATPPLTTSVASTSCSSVLSRKQVIPRKNITQAEAIVNEGEVIDLDIVSPHFMEPHIVTPPVLEPKKKAPAKRKRAPKSVVPPIAKTITIVESSTSTSKSKKRAAPINFGATATITKRLTSSPLNEPLPPPPPPPPAQTIEVATQTVADDGGVGRIIEHIDSLFATSREEQGKHARHIDSQFQASRGEFYSELTKQTKLLRLVREMAVVNAQEIRQLKDMLNRGTRISFQ